MGPGLLAGLGVLLIAILGGVGIWWIYAKRKYRRIRFRANDATTNLDEALENEYDIIVKMIRIAKEYMQHESDTLNNVATMQNPSLLETVGQKEMAIKMMNNAKQALFFTTEQYPEIRDNATMKELYESLSHTEANVKEKMKKYNEEIEFYNQEIKVFPCSKVAKNATPRELFKNGLI